MGEAWTSSHFDLFSIGSWTLYDHIFRMSRYPAEGETVELEMPVEVVEAVHYGDCSANVAAAAAHLGLNVALGMVVGEDFVHSGFESHLRRIGVNIDAVDVRKGKRSGHTYLFFDGQGNGFNLSHLGVAANQDTWRIPTEGLLSCHSCVVNEKFSEFTLAAIKLAREAGALTVINGMVGTAGEKAKQFVRNAEIVIISEKELPQLLRSLACTRLDEIISMGPSTMFVTRGAEGSFILHRRRAYEVKAVPPDRVVDPTGAGDAYTAGVVAGLLWNLTQVEAARVGATISSFVVEEWGCQSNLPSLDQVESRYAQAFGEHLRI